MDIHTKDNPKFHCALCNEPIAWKNPDGTLNISIYREVAFKISNGSIMTVGFCPSCMILAVSRKDLFPHIMESVKDGWEREMVYEGWKPEEIDKYKQDFFGLTIVDWNKA